MNAKPQKQLSRQRLAQIANRAAGMCERHKTRPIDPRGGNLCTECLAKSRIKDPGRRARENARWAAVDWRKPDSVLSRELGVAPSTVGWWRGRHAGGIRSAAKRGRKPKGVQA